MRKETKLSEDNGRIYIAYEKWLSYVGRRADALALRADERRDKLRKAAVSCK